jgi:hypothetical protein
LAAQLSDIKQSREYAGCLVENPDRTSDLTYARTVPLYKRNGIIHGLCTGPLSRFNQPVIAKHTAVVVYDTTRAHSIRDDANTIIYMPGDYIRSLDTWLLSLSFLSCEYSDDPASLKQCLNCH